jgi:hypothetical protein|tara:strand:+ start:536 stop:862 length:327 start_codon:yes stop_codon:yes gene_type:complete
MSSKETDVKKHQLDKMKIVRVDWLDAMSDDNTWQDLKELKKQTLKSVYSVGWILAEDKKNIILISSFDEDAQSGGGGTVIPKSCIKNIIHLKEYKNSDYLPKEEPTKH